MRAELPWNVAGIPPEAREAARAAARREGLSVGEWLTRRILRSFSDMGEDAPPYERSFESRAAPDAWGLPASSASRRDTDDMLSRVSRTETESSDAWRRVEEHLRSVARRLDSAERSQSENNRAMNKTASEINIATREQAQAFDQLGGHVMNIGDRLERLERGQAQEGLKEAVKALHQGLSRLADQITQTANQSAQQVTAISGNLEQLAGRLGQLRNEAEATSRRMEQRLAAIEQESRVRFAAFETETAHSLDQRLGALEKASHFNSEALGQALERLEAQAGLRTELQKRQAETDSAIGRLEESLGALEARGDPAMDRRVDGIEHALSGLVRRVDTVEKKHSELVDEQNAGLARRAERNHPAGVDDSLAILVRRVESMEKRHGELLGELRVNLAAQPAAPAEAAYDPAIFDQKDFSSAENNFDAPPLVEDPTVFGAEPLGAPEDEPSAPAAFAAEPFAPPAPEQDPFPADTFATDAFEPPAPDQSAGPATDEDFLAAARRSVRAAAEAEAGKGGKLGFSWGARAAEADKPRRGLVPGLIAAILLTALAGGIMVSQKFKPAHPTMVPTPHAATNQAPSAQPAPHATVDVAPAPENQSPTSNASNSQQQGAQGPAPAPSVQPRTQAGPAAAASKLPTLDHVMLLANGGNAIAQTIIGLKELDGDGVPANPADATRWLERAAEQGQAVAQYRLGTAYGRGQGVAANPAAAAHWYQLAAAQGNRNAMHNLAVVYASGTAGKKDMAEAARWFAKAAALGLADSQFNLAVLYERGDGVPQSLLDAYKWYAIAASQGDAESRSRLTVLATQLSEDDRTAAQKSAAGFHAGVLNSAANIPPEMADLAGK